MSNITQGPVNCEFEIFGVAILFVMRKDRYVSKSIYHFCEAVLVQWCFELNTNTACVHPENDNAKRNYVLKVKGLTSLRDEGEGNLNFAAIWSECQTIFNQTDFNLNMVK